MELPSRRRPYPGAGTGRLVGAVQRGPELSWEEGRHSRSNSPCSLSSRICTVFPGRTFNKTSRERNRSPGGAWSDYDTIGGIYEVDGERRREARVYCRVIVEIWPTKSLGTIRVIAAVVKNSVP